MNKEEQEEQSDTVNEYPGTGKEIGSISANNPEELARRATEKFYESLDQLLSSEERVVVSLPGGSSVRSFYERIPRLSDFLSEPAWRRIHFFWTDERLVPRSSSESNFRLAEDLFLGELMGDDLIRPEQVHRFPGETTSPGRVLENYSRDLARISDGVIHLPILGVGADGHVGSLFPGSSQLTEDRAEFLLVEDSPKPPKERMTISPRMIRESTYPFLFFIGEEKRDAYECFGEETTSYCDCPCKLALFGSPGVCYVVTDLE